jgi:hypothetical protein
MNSDAPKTDAADQPQPKRKRWRFQFSLRTLMLAVTGIALFLAWFRAHLDAANRQRRAVEGIVNSPFGMLDYSDHSSFSVDPFPKGRKQEENVGGWAPLWLQHWLGHDFFASVVGANIETHHLKYLAELPALRDVFVRFDDGRIFQRRAKPIADLTKLESLSFRREMSGGAIDVEKLCQLFESMQLKFLGLQDNSARIGPQVVAAIKRQSRLESLCLRVDSCVDDVFSLVHDLPSLKFLDIRVDQSSSEHWPTITDAGVAMLNSKMGKVRLEQLDLRGNALTDAAIRDISCLKSLRRLTLISNQFTDAGVAELAKLPHLAELTLSGKITNAGLAELGNVPTLKEVVLFECAAIDDEGMRLLAERCQSLTKVWISDSEITDKGIENLSAMKSLKTVIVTSVKVTSNGASAFKAAHPNIDLQLMK